MWTRCSRNVRTVHAGARDANWRTSAVHNLTYEAQLTTAEVREHCTYGKLAPRAGRPPKKPRIAEHARKTTPRDTREGFVDYLQFGGSGQPPYVPPKPLLGAVLSGRPKGASSRRQNGTPASARERRRHRRPDIASGRHCRRAHTMRRVTVHPAELVDPEFPACPLPFPSVGTRHSKILPPLPCCRQARSAMPTPKPETAAVPNGAPTFDRVGGAARSRVIPAERPCRGVGPANVGVPAKNLPSEHPRATAVPVFSLDVVDRADDVAPTAPTSQYLQFPKATDSAFLEVRGGAFWLRESCGLYLRGGGPSQRRCCPNARTSQNLLFPNAADSTQSPDDSPGSCGPAGASLRIS